MGIRKALIPTAGLATRMGPIGRAVPKAMLPLVDAAGRVRPVLHHVVAEARAGGAAEVGLIVAPWQEAMVRRYVDAACAAGDDAFEGVELLVQDEPLGFGHAVAVGADFVGAECFLLLLGDHVYFPEADAPPCGAQVAAAFAESGGAAAIGMKTVDAAELARVGVAAGERLGGRLYRCTALMEKPTPQVAARRLVTPGLPPGCFLGHLGIYAFTAEIFDCIAEVSRRPRRPGQEIELTDAEALLRRRHPAETYLLWAAGVSVDVGRPAGYAEAFDRIRSGVL